MLQKQYQITASSYFRRGPYYGSANDNFQNIINVFQTIFDKNIKQPIKMLIVGIGDSQEPFSYLAVIKNIIKYQNLSSILLGKYIGPTRRLSSLKFKAALSISLKSGASISQYFWKWATALHLYNSWSIYLLNSDL